MAGALVFIFLLDYLPGNTLNRTLEDISPLGHQITNVRQCGRDPHTDPILRAINSRLNIKLVPQWRLEHDQLVNLYLLNSSDITKDSSEETLYQLQTVLENSIENSNSLEKPINFVDLKRTAENEIAEDKSECENEVWNVDVGDSFRRSSNVSDLARVSFPERVPALVAIFETLANVTAQTCGGTLVSPHWVLTAATCINLLGNLYNTSDLSERSQYTVIAGARNPLVEGALHAVTRVLLHPGVPATIAGLIQHLHHTFEQSKMDVAKKETREEKNPVLALMRVEPAVEADSLEILDGRLADGEDVVMYGWVLTKNSSGDSMSAASFPARTLSPFECEVHYGVADARSLLCLVATNDTAGRISQMSTGGPVVCERGGRVGVCGVAQADEHAPYAAYPLAAHARWLAGVVREHYNT